MPHCCSGHESEDRRRHAELPDLTEKLRRKSRKVTGPRQAILAILRTQRHPISIKTIHQALPEGDCDLATVYRSIRLLESMGMVKKFEFGDGSARYELLGDGDDGHHHHLVCTRCSEVVELEECFIRQIEQRIAEQSGFVAVTHKLEFFGVCPGCRGSEAQPE